MTNVEKNMGKICMVAYTHYERDPRVRRDAEALIEAGYAVDVIALKDGTQPPKEIISGVQIYHVPMARLRGGGLSYVFTYLAFFIFTSCYVSVLHLRNRYGLIHVHNMPDFLVFSALLPKLMGVPIILDIHDPMPELFFSIFTGKEKSIFYNILIAEEKISFWFADQLITTSQGIVELLTSRDVPPARLEVIHNLPDPAIFRATDSIRKKQETFTIVYAGSVSRRRMLDLALLAISKLKNEMPDLRLKIIGEGPDVSRLKTLANEYNIEKQVEFEGIVPVVAIPGLISQCDTAIASISNDTFGNAAISTKAIEALIMGIPVISTRVASMLYYFDESALFYYEPDDVDSLIEQIRLMREQPELVDAKMDRCRKILEHFNWDQEKAKYIRIVENLCRARLMHGEQSSVSKDVQ